MAANFPNRRPTLEELIAKAKASGKLVRAVPEITSKNFPETTLRKGMKLLKLEGNFGPRSFQKNSELLEAVEANHYHATMYQLVCYANYGWDGASLVLALGSVWQGLGDYQYVGCLWSYPQHGPTLGLSVMQIQWDKDYRLLAARK